MSRPPLTHDTLTAILRATRVVPVLRTDTRGALEDAADRLADAGLGVIELTATSPGWAPALTALAGRWPDVHFAVGTVTLPSDAERAADAGAAFLVSPRLAPGVRAVAPVPFVEGGMTPGELAQAVSGGRVAKLFPAATGGPGHLRAVLDVLPGAAIMPTGGVRLADLDAWLAAGALCVGIGSELTRDDGGLAERIAALRVATGTKP
jgi:2-dehydro-3-deoxyphosphogluconate aldolase/(4S)-4-hydroxy-2-oxoglutarate aldolase